MDRSRPSVQAADTDPTPTAVILYPPFDVGSGQTVNIKTSNSTPQVGTGEIVLRSPDGSVATPELSDFTVDPFTTNVTSIVPPRVIYETSQHKTETGISTVQVTQLVTFPSGTPTDNFTFIGAGISVTGNATQRQRGD